MPRPADRRAKIELLRAAEAVFVEHGLEAAKVEDITARAGVSKGAFYLHFAGKDDCWRQIIEGFLAKLAACVGPPPDAAEMRVETAAERFEAWHRHDLEVLEFCWQNRGLMRTVVAGGGGTSYAYLIDEFAERTARQIAAVVEQGVKAGLYRSGLDPAIVAALVGGGYDRLVREIVKQPRRPDIAAWSRQAIDLFTRGLLTDGARAVLDRKVTKGGARPPEAAPPSPPRRAPRPRRS